MLRNRSSSKSINQINFVALLFAGLFAFIFAGLIIVNEYFTFKKETLTLQEGYVNAQKKSVEIQMNQLLRIVEYRYSQDASLQRSEILSKLNNDIRSLFAPSDEYHYIFVKNASGDLLYHSEPFNSDTHDDMLVTHTFEPLSLVLGSGVITSKMNDALAQKNDEYKDKIINFILKTYLLTMLMYMVSTIEYRYVSDTMAREIRFIVESFKKASQNYDFIDMQKIKFNEFQEIVTHANTMIGEIRDKNNELLALNGNLENLVEQKTEELKKLVLYTQELLDRQDQFVKNAIHEINTPLSIILMNIDLYNLKHEKNTYLSKIEAAVKVLDNIYEDLAYVAKKDRVTYTKSMLNMSEFLEERVAYFEEVAEGNKLHFEMSVASEQFIEFNEIELQRIVDNNLSNAIKYSYENEPIFIRLYSDETCVVFEVENVGEPIESIDSVFKRYYRENEARGGFGLGLNIVKEICDRNDVTIDVMSEKTTRFCYRFLKG